MALKERFAALRSLFVGLVYADHNRSPVVRRVIAQELEALGPDGFALNVGAGGTRIDPRVRNLDIIAGPEIRLRRAGGSNPAGGQHSRSRHHARDARTRG